MKREWWTALNMWQPTCCTCSCLKGSEAVRRKAYQMKNLRIRPDMTLCKIMHQTHLVWTVWGKYLSHQCLRCSSTWHVNLWEPGTNGQHTAERQGSVASLSGLDWFDDDAVFKEIRQGPASNMPRWSHCPGSEGWATCTKGHEGRSKR